MKTKKRLAAGVLLLTMLLGTFGSGFTASALQTVTTDSELAFEPLAGSASIAYEKHEDGYAVSLDRAADCVTMNITAVPGSEDSRAAEKARLYVHTGVELKPGSTYRVSFSLSAERAQPNYAVCFDGGAAEGAYGMLDGRSIDAGGVDKVQYQVTPEKGSGELVLRLLLGKTGAAGNTLRLANLSVEEAPANQIGESVVLADNLDYNTPGFIRYWTNTDAGAEVVCDDESATLTVTKEPAEGEVWKIKLLVAPGLTPQAGKAYRFTADVESTAARSFEVCFNEGETEKGYGAQYSQRLRGKSQKLEYMVNIPADKKDPGELIFQFSLGMLKKGDKVTLSNIFIEEAQASCKRVLSDGDIDFRTAADLFTVEPYVKETGASGVSTAVSWNGGASVSATGDYKGSLTTSGSSAALEIKGGTLVYHARLNIDTGETLSKDTTYRVSFKIEADKAYEDYEVLYGTGYNPDGIGNNEAYGSSKGRSLAAKTTETVEHIITPESDGPLLISLQVGKTGGKSNAVTVSDIEIQEVVPGAPSGGSLAAGVKYPTAGASGSEPSSDPGSFDVRADGGFGGTISGDGSSATIKCTGGDAGDGNAWKRGLFTGDVCTLESGSSYTVSFYIKATAETQYEICNSKDTDWNPNEGAFGYNRGLSASTDWSKCEYTINADASGKLRLRIDLGRAGEGVEVSVKDIQVEKTGSGQEQTFSGAAVDYPDEDSKGSFDVRADGDFGGSITGDGSSAAMTCTGGDAGDGNAWKRGMFTGKICDLDAGAEYEVSFSIMATEEIKYDVCYNKDGDWGDGHEKVFGDQYGLTASSSEWSTCTYTVKEKDAGALSLRIDLGRAGDGVEVTVKDIQVEKTGSGQEQSSGPIKVLVTYPSVSGSGGSGGSSGNFRLRDNTGGTITGDGTSATLVCTQSTNGTGEWARGLIIEGFDDLEPDTTYQISYNIDTENESDRNNCRICFNNINADGVNEFSEGGGFIGETCVWKWVEGPVEHRITTKPGGKSKLLLRLDLGELPVGAKVTISNIQVKKIEYSPTGSPTTIDGFGSVWAEQGEGFTTTLTKGEDSAALEVTKPAGAESKNWNAKLFVRTDVTPASGEYYRVSFDIHAANAQKEFCAIYGNTGGDNIGSWEQSIAAGETKTVTSPLIPASAIHGSLTLQIELGNLDGSENTFTVSNVNVERVGVNVSYDYLNNLILRDDYAALRVTETTEFTGRMEAWMVKLFVKTGVLACKDETFRVTYDIRGTNDFDFETNYNRDKLEDEVLDEDETGESEYGSRSGIHAAGGETRTVEHFFTASKDGWLTLQLMLGLVEAPNTLTVSNIRVDQVTYSYSGESALPGKADYREPSAVSYWAHEDYAVSFNGSDRAITANITQAPQAGAEPWKVKLFLDTGAALKAGKYYKVTANVTGASSQSYDICYNNGGIEMGYDSLGGLRLAAGKTQTVEKIISVPADKKDLNNLTLQFNLGKTGKANAVTVSGVRVEEVPLAYVDMMPKDFTCTGSAVDIWTYNDYTAQLESSDGSATIHITGVPSTGAEVWKAKLLVSTGALLSPGRTYLVRADLLSAKDQNYEVCFNNEETEKGFDALYGQWIAAGKKTTVEKAISVPGSMTDAGELILQFSVGGSETNDFTVSGISVQELNFGAGSGSPAPDTVISLYNAPQTAAGTLDVTRAGIKCGLTKISSQAGDNTLKIAGADLRANDYYTVTFKARASKNMTATFELCQAGGVGAVISQQLNLTTKKTTYSFKTKEPLTRGGLYDLLWKFGSQGNQKLGGADVEISAVSVYSPPEKLEIIHLAHNVTVNGKAVMPDVYNINGSNYFKLRDLAVLMNDTDAQFAVRYIGRTNSISLTSGKAYAPVGGELTVGEDLSASCRRSSQSVSLNGAAVKPKAYNIGGSNYVRIRDLGELLGFTVDYSAQTGTVVITSPLTPEAQEKAHAYDIFFLPEADGGDQAYVGDTMPYYEDGVYYIYYLKDGGDSYNHSVYLTTTTDFVSYTEYDEPVLSASREDVQDNWIGTGSVVKVDGTYYFFYTGYNASGSQEYHEKIMAAKGSSPTSFEKVSGWEIVPPSSLGQKNDFRDPQAYYDPATQTISLTVTASQGGTARILKYTLGKNLNNARYDGIIFTDPTGAFFNLECSDTFRIGSKWYLTYSGQEDTLWYSTANSRFGPYSAPKRLDGKLFYAAKHVEDGTNVYMVGWGRRANSPSSTYEVSGWAGNVVVQKLIQQRDGSLALAPADSIVSSFGTQMELASGSDKVSLKADSGCSFEKAFTSYDSFMLSGEFTYSGSGCFGLAFDFNGREEQYKLISLDPAENSLGLYFEAGEVLITETQAALKPNQTYSFTYIQDGSVGIFYLDGQAALVVRMYGVTDKPVYLFAENNSVEFTSLRQYT